MEGDGGPNLYKAPPKRELTQEEKILAASGRSDLIPTDAPQMIEGTNIAVYAQVRRSMAVPPPPPETFGAYQKKDGKSANKVDPQRLWKPFGDCLSSSLHLSHAC